MKLAGAKAQDRFDCSHDSEGRIILRKLAPVPGTVEAPRSRKRLLRRKDGTTVLAGGERYGTEDVRRMLEEFP